MTKDDRISTCSEEYTCNRWLKWVATSKKALLQAEGTVLKFLVNLSEVFYVTVLGRQKLRTIVLRSNNDTSSANNSHLKVSALLLHGWAAGLGFWCKNLDSLSEQRNVYALDLLGFGNSSRPPFPSNCEEAEDLFVESIEDWRSEMNLSKIVLIGHSFGGYLSCAYALKYPQRVRHLILVDPWGFQEFNERYRRPRSWAFRCVERFIGECFVSPLALLRIAGPWGSSFLRYIRKDIGEIFSSNELTGLNDHHFNEENSEMKALSQPIHKPSISDDLIRDIDDISGPHGELSGGIKNGLTKEGDCCCADAIYNYLYHCNAQPPSGEYGFRAMCNPCNGFASKPMINRIADIDKSIPTTFVFGERTWMDIESGHMTKQIRAGSYVDVRVISNAGHHVYAEKDQEFNTLINDILSKIDDNLDCLVPNTTTCQSSVTPSSYKASPAEEHLAENGEPSN